MLHKALWETAGCTEEDAVARLAVEMKGRKKRASGLLSTDDVNLNRKEWARYSAGARRTSRFIFSWMALMLGIFSLYTATHYAPSLFDRDGTIFETSKSTASMKLDMDDGHILSPYIKLFDLKRGYFRAGQKVTAQYDAPRGAQVELTLTRCKRAVVVEVFQCFPEDQQTVKITDSSGARKFVMPATGFYYLQEKVTLRNADDDYRIVWRRS